MAEGTLSLDRLLNNEHSIVKVEEIAGALLVSEMTVRRWIEAGDLAATKLGGTFRVPKQSLIDMLNHGATGCKWEWDDKDKLWVTVIEATLPKAASPVRPEVSQETIQETVGQLNKRRAKKSPGT